MEFFADQGRRERRPPAPSPRPAGDTAGREYSSQPAPPAGARLSARTAAALQRQAGNRAVSRLVAQRRAAAAGTAKPRGSAPVKAAVKATPVQSSPPTESPRTPSPTEEAGGDVDRVERALAAPVQRLAKGSAGGRSGPGSDPKFAALKRDVKTKQQTVGKHPPPTSEASAAQGAARPPQDDKQAQGKAANAEKMNAAKPGEFDKAAFIKAVNDAIAKQAPKNLDEADKFGDSGKANAVKGEVQGKVGAGKQASAKAIETTTKAPPDTSKAKEKKVTPLRPDSPPATPGRPNPEQAVPDKAPASATDFSGGPKQVDGQMADAQVTEEQLAKSNEPEFTGALKAKKAGEKQAAESPGVARAGEAKTLAGAKAQAGQAGAAAMGSMATDRAKAGKDVGAGKEGAKGEDEKKREQVTAKLQTVFDATKKDVEGILGGLDKKVDEKFDAGEKAARDAFTADYTRKIDAYKDKRYSGLRGKWNWTRDLFAGLPDEVNTFYAQARQGYVTSMQGVISSVADVIGAELGRAKQRIAKGRADLQAEVQSLSPDLQAIGKKAAGEFAGKFDDLTQQVNDKGTELVDTLASKYTEALKKVDEQIEAEKEKNKGLIAKAVDAVKGVIDTILKLKDLLLGVLAKAARAVSAIIKDPIGFLGKLVSAVGAGLKAFMANIANHLKKGLVSWLLGAAAKAGLQLPEKFDLKGILLLIGSLLGLTWAAIRGRVVQRGVPEQAMTAVESSVPVAQKVKSEGIGGMWEEIKDKVGDLKGSLLGKIAQYLIPTVLIAGITWIISLLNPASAFVKACKAIIDIVTFIIERGAQIFAFVNAVLDAVIAIAAGGAGGVPGLIENALALSIPVLIGFLAALLGIGGLADKVKKLFQSLSKPVMKAVDWVVGKIVGLAKKLWAKIKSKFGKNSKSPAERKKAAARSAEVRAGVADDLRSRLADGVDPARIRPVVSDVYGRWRSRGLKEIDVVSHGPTSDQFDFLVRASRKGKVFDVKCDLREDPTAGTSPDRPDSEQPFRVPVDIQELDRDPKTRAKARLSWPAGLDTLRIYEGPGRRSSDRLWDPDGNGELVPRRTLKKKFEDQGKKWDKEVKGVHAEIAVIEDIRSKWGMLPQVQGFKERLGYGPLCWLRMDITRSPCGKCAKAIIDFKDHASSMGWLMKVRVAALTLFNVKRDTSEARAALALLAASGIEISVLEMSEAQKKALAKKDAKLARKMGEKTITMAQAVEEAKKKAECRLG